MKRRPLRTAATGMLVGMLGCVTSHEERVDAVGSGETSSATEATPASTSSPASSPSSSLGAPVKSQPAPVDAGSTPAASTIPDAGTEVASTPDASGAAETADAAVAPGVTDPLLATKLPFRGVHLAGAEFGSDLPGVEGYDYDWPTNAEIDYFVGKGMNTFRIGFMWERLQATPYASFEAPYLAKLDGLVRHGTAVGAYIVLDPHNFARYYDDLVGSPRCPNAVFADFWRRLAVLYGRNPHVVFDLVNEPHDMPTEQWVSAANAAIAAIRGAGATNLIEVPGNAWTGAYTWNNDDYGTPNAVAMLDIVDPANHFVYEAHQYLDSDGGGESYDCTSRTVGSQRLQPFVSWLRAHAKKGVLGEFAGGRNATCKAAISDMMATIDASADVLVGWTWWAAGPGWGDYQFSLEPDNGDAVQMSWLAPYTF